MRLSDLRRIYVHNRIIFMKGYGEVGILVNVWNTAALLLLTLTNLLGRSMQVVWLVVIIMPCVIMVFYLVGLLFYKRRFFDEEQQWLADVSPPYHNTIRLLDEINMKLDNIEKELKHD